jgi:ABC-2 type transport system ATP-binding protein
LTTQYLEEADQLADKIVVIDGGKVIAEGTAKELKAKVGRDRLELTFASEKLHRQAVKVLGESIQESDADEKTVTLVLKDTNADVRKVLDTLQQQDLRFEAMAVHKPTLDDVFLALTGKQTKDSEEEK